VLSTATIKWFRTELEAFVPVGEVYSLQRACLRSAVAIHDWGAIIGLITSMKEADQRVSIVRTEDLVKRLIELGRPRDAAEHIADGQLLRVEPKDAMSFCLELARYAGGANDEDAMRQASRIFNLAKPVHLMYGGDGTFRSEFMEIMSGWAAASAYFSTVETVCDTILALKITEQDYHGNETDHSIRASLLFSYLRETLKRGLFSKAPLVLNALEDLHEDIWTANGWLEYIENLQKYHGRSCVDEIRHLIETSDVSSLGEIGRLSVAECLWRAGLQGDAVRVIEPLETPRPEPYPEMAGKSRLGTPWARVRLAGMRVVLGFEPQPVQEPESADNEGSARVAAACNEIGQMWGEARGKTKPPFNLAARFERLIAYRTRIIRYSLTGRHIHDAEVNSHDVFEALCGLSRAYGHAGRSAFKAAFLRSISPNSYPGIPDYLKRLVIVDLCSDNTMSATEALAILRRAMEGVDASDAAERSEIRLDIAVAFHRLGDEASAQEWLARAASSAHGVGNHKDYQMSTWVDWLDRSLGVSSDAVRHPAVQLAARLLELDGGAAEAAARTQLLGGCFRRNPMVGVRLGIEMIERGTCQISDILEVIIMTGATAGADPVLLCSVFARLYTLIEPNINSKVGSRLVHSRRTDVEAEDVARQCIAAIRVNSPSDQRRGAVRAILDAMMQRGIPVPEHLADGLQPDREESVSSSWLYNMGNGDLRSVAEAGAFLSDPIHTDLWDPNPAGNEYFVWDEAIDNVTLQSVEHLRELEGRFVRKSHRDVSVLAALARSANRWGDHNLSSDFAMKAFNLSRDGGWLTTLDGAPKRKALTTLIQIDSDRWKDVAQSEFENDIAQGRISGFWLHSEIAEILDELKIEWPKIQALCAVQAYFEGIADGATLLPEYESLLSADTGWSHDEAICWFLVELYAHPVPAVAAAARQASEDYLGRSGKAFLRSFQDIPRENTIVIERALMALDTAAKHCAIGISAFQHIVASWALIQNAAVEALARRVASKAGWKLPMTQPIDLPATYMLEIPDVAASISIISGNVAEEIPGTGLGIALELYDGLIHWMAERAGLPYRNVRVRCERHYSDIDRTFPWTANANRKLDRWQRSVPVRSFFRPQALVARDAVMRGISELVRAGRIDDQALNEYDHFIPGYDPYLETVIPAERPLGLSGINIDRHHSMPVEWVTDPEIGAVEPLLETDGRVVLAEHSHFRRQDWDWPWESRASCPVPHNVDTRRLTAYDDFLPSVTRCTVSDYFEGIQFPATIAVVSNSACELSTPASRWLALNPALALLLGWLLSDTGLFRWEDLSGRVMVESVWWRDGWLELEPPRTFCTQGEGWIVLCAPAAYAQIVQQIMPAKIVMATTRELTKDYGEGERFSRVSFAERAI
jgi:hypothetical protein